MTIFILGYMFTNSLLLGEKKTEFYYLSLKINFSVVYFTEKSGHAVQCNLWIPIDVTQKQTKQIALEA